MHGNVKERLKLYFNFSYIEIEKWWHCNVTVLFIDLDFILGWPGRLMKMPVNTQKCQVLRLGLEWKSVLKNYTWNLEYAKHNGW